MHRELLCLLPSALCEARAAILAPEPKLGLSGPIGGTEQDRFRARVECVRAPAGDDEYIARGPLEYLPFPVRSRFEPAVPLDYAED